MTSGWSWAAREVSVTGEGFALKIQSRAAEPSGVVRQPRPGLPVRPGGWGPEAPAYAIE